jgi:hypothetical protein
MLSQISSYTIHHHPEIGGVYIGVGGIIGGILIGGMMTTHISPSSMLPLQLLSRLSHISGDAECSIALHIVVISDPDVQSCVVVPVAIHAPIPRVQEVEKGTISSSMLPLQLLSRLSHISGDEVRGIQELPVHIPAEQYSNPVA